jgi:tetratricopeptide (TPR) repeat protein
MKRTLSIVTAAALAFAALPAFASFGGGSKPEPSTSSSSSSSSSETSATPREEAEQIYAKAYEDVAAAKKDLADGKTKNAEKKLKRALSGGEKATSLDATYHEAWNLVGYTARKLGDYDKAFAAYEKCLNIKPDYAPAREYMGEAWLEKGDAQKAHEQLTLLESYGDRAADDAKTLRTAIEAYETAHAPAAAASSNGGGTK